MNKFNIDGLDAKFARLGNTTIVPVDFIRLGYNDISNAISPTYLKFVEDAITNKLRNQKSIFIVFNVGHWYHDLSHNQMAMQYDLIRNQHLEEKGSRSNYLADLNSLFVMMSNLPAIHPTKNFIFLWAESTATHYAPTGEDIGNGYFSGHHHENHKLKCTAIKDVSAEADWRNMDVSLVLLSNKTLFSRSNSHFVKLPMRKLTEPLWDLHPTKIDHNPDCVHFCWTPMLFQPVFALMADTSKYFDMD